MNKIILKLIITLLDLIEYPILSPEDLAVAEAYTSLKSLYKFEKNNNLSSLVGFTSFSPINFSKEDAIKYITSQSEKYDNFKIEIKDSELIKELDKVYGQNVTITQKIIRMFSNLCHGIMLKNYYKKYRQIHLNDFYMINS